MSRRPRVSVSMIVRDEEAWLDECLRLVGPIADEIVVVDTGSTDRTPEIAERRGARVFSFPWTGSFGEARTEAVRRCNGDWLLWVDADEHVRVPDASLLTELLSDTKHAAYWNLFHRRPGFTANWQVRLFRNHPKLLFEGVIHEKHLPSLDRLFGSPSADIGFAGVVFQHYGYEGDQERRNRRNLPLLLEAVGLYPDHIFMRCHLARTHEAFGEPLLAEEQWLAALEVEQARADPHLGESFAFTGLIEHRLRAGADASTLIAAGRYRFPENLQLVWYAGTELVREARYPEAMELFQQLVECGRTQLFDHTVGYDQRVLGVLPEAALQACRSAMAGVERCVSIDPLAAQPAVYYAHSRHHDHPPDPALYQLCPPSIDPVRSLGGNTGAR